MVCHRCHGLLVSETFEDLNIDTDVLYAGTRCINCGCIEDAVIRANRSRRVATMRRSRSGRGRARDIKRINIHVDAYASIRRVGAAIANARAEYQTGTSI